LYGTGALLILVLISPVQENLLLLFCGGFLVATVVEYAIAVLLEKLFHASWWDYSKKKLNIKGRVCLERSVEWGLLTVFVMRFVQPAVADFVSKIPLVFGEVFGTALMIYLFADAGVTVQQILHLNEKLAHLSEAREELRAKLESTKLYTARQELAEYFENHPTAEFLREWKARMDETFGDIEQMQMEERLRGEYIFNEIRERLEYKARALEQDTRVQRRLMKAFPGLRSKRFDKELQEMRAQMEARKRNRKQQKGEQK
ncbi:putative ABC transporter permease, partial [Anaerotignum sp.]|uniref:putative ABC transporter permease n=1 Tax=Anaerotignum sp. TaxID=2039241 RepID=UPI003735E15F